MLAAAAVIAVVVASGLAYWAQSEGFELSFGEDGISFGQGEASAQAGATAAMIPEARLSFIVTTDDGTEVELGSRGGDIPSDARIEPTRQPEDPAPLEVPGIVYTTQREIAAVTQYIADETGTAIS